MGGEKMVRFSEDGHYLLEQIENGSQEAFEMFYDRYHSFVFSIAYKVLQKEQEAEDICHDIFIEISKKASTYEKSRGSIEAWLAIRTRSRCLDLIRRRRELLTGDINEERETSLPSHQLSVEDKVITRFEQQLIYKALKKLPLPQQKAIYGSYFNNFSHRELAEKLKVPLGTVKSLVRYGIKNLRKELQQSKSFNSLGGDDDKHDM